MSTFRILIVGASGFIGKCLFRELSQNHKVFGTYFENKISDLARLDVRHKDSVIDIFEKTKPDIIFQPAAEPNVDLCEEEKETTYEINVIGTKNIVDMCKDRNVKLVYFSTDYIFDGKSGPYQEDDIPNPINEYGRQKLECENIIKKNLTEYLIIRTTVVFGNDSKANNFLMQMLRSLNKNEKRKVPTDQFSQPTYIKDLIRGCVKLMETNKNGVYNLVGEDYLNRYNFALKVAKIFNLNGSLIIPVSTTALGRPAKRPLKAGLRTDKIKKEINMKFSTLNEALFEIKQETELK